MSTNQTKMLLEVEFKNRPKISRIELEDDGKIHSYTVRKDETLSLNIEILPGNQIPARDNSDRKRNFTALRRSISSKGAPARGLRVLLSREVTAEDRAANSLEMKKHAATIDRVEKERERNRSELIDLVEREDEASATDLEWAVGYLRSSSRLLRELQTKKYRYLKRTLTYLDYSIEENVTTILKDVPGVPIVRLIGKGNYTTSQTDTPAPILRRESEMMRYALMYKHLVFQRHESDVFAVAFSPNGKLVASSSDDRMVRVWDVETGEQNAQYELDNDAGVSLAFSPDGKYLALGTQAGASMALSLGTKDLPLVWEGTSSDGTILSVAYSPDGTRIITGGYNVPVTIWNSADGKVVRHLERPREDVLSVAFSPDGNRIIAGGEDGTIRIWDSGSGVLTSRIEVNKSISALAFSPDSLRACVGTRDGKLHEWDLLSENKRRTWNTGSSRIVAVVYSTDGSKLVSSGGPDEGAVVWDVDSGELLQELQGDSTALYSIAFSPDNTGLAIGAVSGIVTVWGCD